MSQETSSARPNDGRQRGNKVLFGILGTLGTIGVVVIATLLFGINTGEEFSPKTFARRSFFYYEIPLLGVQVTPVVRKDETSSFERSLRQDGYVKSAGPARMRWDLVQHAELPHDHRHPSDRPAPRHAPWTARPFHHQPTSIPWSRASGICEHSSRSDLLQH